MLPFSFSLKLAGSRSATSNLATALLSARGRASNKKSGPQCDTSPGSSAFVFQPLSAHSTCDVSMVELDVHMLLFALKITRSSCNGGQCLNPKAVTQS